MFSEYFPSIHTSPGNTFIPPYVDVTLSTPKHEYGVEMQQRFIRLPELLSRLGISKSTFYTMIQHGEFDPPIKLGARTSVWLESSIDKYIDKKVAESQKVAA